MRLGPTPRARRLSQGVVITAFYGALLLVAVGIGAARHHADVFLVGAGPPRGLFVSALGGLAMGGVAVFFSRLVTRRLQWARVLHQEFHALVHQLGSVDIFLLALSSSVAEEAFFRGALQPMVGVVPQAVLFAALHFRPRPRFYPWTAMSLGVGMLFGLFTLWRGDLCMAIVAHFTINVANLSYIARTELRT